MTNRNDSGTQGEPLVAAGLAGLFLRVTAYLSLLWVVFVASELTLNVLVPDTVFHGAELPASLRLSLLGYAVLAATPFVLVLGIVPVLFAQSVAGQSLPAKIIRRSLTLTVWVILLAYGASWATFRTTGQFLDREGLLFWARQPVQLFHWIDLYLTAGVLLVTLVSAAALNEWLPEFVKRSRPLALRRITAATFALAGLCLLAASYGELRRGQRVPLLPDGANLGEYTVRQDYRAARDYRAGPFAFALADLRTGNASGTEHLPAHPDIKVVRRPILSLQQYATRVDRTKSKKWNVILLLVESLRADQLEIYGGSREVMPRLEQLASESRVFTNAYTQASHSNYADISPISSHYPLRSEASHHYPENPPYPRVLIYDVLDELGYQTAVISSQNEHWGGMMNYLQTGHIDHFFHSETFDGATYVMLGDFGFAEWVKNTKHAGSVDDQHTVSHAIQWIDDSQKEPFFLYMNLQNSHVPYVVPADFKRPFGPEKLDFTINFGHFPRDKVEVVRNVYADSLAYIDLQIGRLIQYLKTAGLWERTLFVVTGDTGQAFYEHGFASHASKLYNEVMKVPLIIRAPGLEPGIDDRPAQHVDIPPSILYLLGLPPHAGFQGVNLFDLNANADRSLYLVVQTPLAHQCALIRSGFKLIYDNRESRYYLYDLRSDPEEKVDLATSRPELVRTLAGRLHRWFEEQIQYYADSGRMAAEYPPVLDEGNHPE